ncbi:MAG: rRNA processing protein RimM [Pyrinomonadaceae bacterium]|jgi:16S rRNA processing protein RimM|nr:rRNA processing protein RimM [Pyrinomonadaceae bacterium]
MKTGQEESADDLIIVARAVRTRGLKGELVADVLTDFPERFASISELTGVGPGGERQQLLLENYWFQNDRMVLKFAGYDDIETAKALIGYHFGLPEADRVDLSEGEFYDWELEGCEVAEQQGETLGRVREVMRTGGVALLVVDSESRPDLLIPLAEAIVVSVDIPNQKILIDPPEGLLDL